MNTMKKNEHLYKVSVSKGTENATLIATTYELQENSNVYFVELKLGPHTIQHPDISIPNNRQANDTEELFILGNTTLMISGNRTNEESDVSNKVKEIFSGNPIMTIERM